ncbi:MAG: TonB-dependent receptor, partial [Acidobacteriota bacterium]
AWAQVNTGTILGTVQDASGAVLPGAEVVATHIDQGRSRTAISDDEGRYRFPNLNLGNYEVEASLPGFQTSVRTGIAIGIDQRAVVDLTLNIGEISERVTVTGEAPLVETTSGSLGSIVNRTTVQELPINGRDLTALLTLGTGAVNVTSASQGGNAGFSRRVSISGARPQDTAVLLDGTATKSTDQGVPAGVSGNFLGGEGIQEFRIEKNSYSAEYGGASGGIINVVSKAGTNQFHGSVYEYHRNDNLDASNFFSNRDGLEKAPLIRNQFGFSVGGPIVENQTFFFFNYEGFRERKSTPQTLIVPNLNTRQGLLPTGPGGALEPVADGSGAPVSAILPYFDLWPVPGSSAVDLGNGTTREGVTTSSPINEDYYQFRVDHNFSDSDSLYARFTYQDSEQNRIAEQIDRWKTRDLAENRFLTIEHKHIFSPTLLNTFRFGFGRRRTGENAFEDCSVCDPALRFVPDEFWQAPLGADPVQGRIQINDEDLAGVGIAAQNNGAGWLDSLTDNYNYMDDIIYNRGAHSLKFGFSWWRISTGGENPSRPGGYFEFDGATMVEALTNFMQDSPDVFRGGILPGIDSKRKLKMNIIGWYIQDDWQITPNLTANLGLRHEFYTVPVEVDGKLSNLISPLTDTEVTVLGTRDDKWFENPSLASFMPRIGLAWDPTGSGKTAIRAGAGLFYNHIQPDVYRRALFRSTPFMKETNLRGGGFPFIGIFDAVVNGGLANEDLQPFDYNMKNPHMYQWNLSVQQEILPGTAASIGYVGNRGVNQMNQACVNSATAQDVNGRLVVVSGSQRPNQAPAFSRLCLLQQQASSNAFHHGLQMGLERRFIDGFQLQVSYTFSKTIDQMSQVNGLYQNDGNGISYYPDPALSQGLAAYHVGNVFSTSGVWQLPGSGMAGAARYLLDGWQLSGIVSLADGPPTTLEVSRPGNLAIALNGRTQKPDLVPGFSNNPVLGGPDQYYDRSAFVTPPSRTLGNVGRNTLIAPGVANVDLSLAKNTPIGEFVNLQFRAEFFNIFNRANFGLPNERITSSSGGRIDQTTLTNRQIQFGLRLEF